MEKDLPVQPGIGCLMEKGVFGTLVCLPNRRLRPPRRQSKPMPPHRPLYNEDTAPYHPLQQKWSKLFKKSAIFSQKNKNWWYMFDSRLLHLRLFLTFFFVLFSFFFVLWSCLIKSLVLKITASMITTLTDQKHWWWAQRSVPATVKTIIFWEMILTKNFWERNRILRWWWWGEVWRSRTRFMDHITCTTTT